LKSSETLADKSLTRKLVDDDIQEGVQESQQEPQEESQELEQELVQQESQELEQSEPKRALFGTSSVNPYTNAFGRGFTMSSCSSGGSQNWSTHLPHLRTNTVPTNLRSHNATSASLTPSPSVLHPQKSSHESP